MNSQWIQTNGPTGGAVSTLAAIGTNVFAGSSDGGGVFLSTDFGTSWKHIDSGFAYTPVKALTAYGTSLLAGTDKGIFLTNDNGKSWNNVGVNGLSVNAITVGINSGGVTKIFAGVSSSPAVYMSTNGGAYWNAATNSGLSASAVYSLAVSSLAAGGTALFAGTSSGVFYSTNDGGNWTASNTGLTGAYAHSMVVGPDSAGKSSLFMGSYGKGVFRMSQNGSSWVAASNGLTSLYIYSLVANGNVMYAGTGAGLFATSDGGRSWSPIVSGLATNRINALLFVPSGGTGGSSFFAGTDQGVCLSTNNASTWVSKNSGLANTVIYAFGVSGKNLFAGTYGGGVCRSTDNGTSWTTVNDGLTNLNVDAFAVTTGTSGNTVFAGTGAGVFVSTNDGISWSSASSGLTNTTVLALATMPASGSSGTNLFAGTMGGVFISSNNGATWNAANSGLASLSVMCLAVSGTNLFAGTYDGGVFLSSDHGRSWVPTSVGLPNKPINVLAVIPNSSEGANLFAGTEGSGVYRSTNNATSWSAAGLATQQIWAFGVSGTNLFVGDNFGIWYTTDNGAVWRTASTGLTNVKVISFGIIGSDIVTGTIGGGVFRRGLYEMIPRPCAWTAQISPLGYTALGQIQFVSPTEGWVVMGNGKLLHTTNSGSAWSTVNVAGTDTVWFNTDNLRALSPMSFTSPSTGWVIGTLGTSQQSRGPVLFKTTDGGSIWVKQSIAGWSTAFGTQFVDATHGWVEVLTGIQSSFTYAILRTTDGGNQWTTAYTSNTSLLAPHFIDANIGWGIVGIPGGTGSSIVRTSNGGTTWTEQRSDNTAGSLNRVQFVDANNGWVIGDSAKIFKTTNGGNMWTQLTNAPIDRSTKLKSMYFLNANCGWIAGQVASGAIPTYLLHTTNGGATWTIDGGSLWSPPNNPPFEASIMGLCFVDANTGWMSTYHGDLVKTTSGGVITSVRLESKTETSQSFVLEQNYPNPFNPSTTIRYELSEPTYVSLSIYNMLGQLVSTLVDERKGPGCYQVQWTTRVPSGIYLCQLRAGCLVATKKMIVVK
ncbi:MAG: YCF48-related protein [Ignavibacteriales bacterium]|nr:YCF48-related protein [Ignavibacteriales bacterium]